LLLLNLTIGGSAPANIGAAYTSLASVFPNANSGSGGSGGDFSSLVEFGTLVTDFPFEFRVYA
jgi:hypothetical protein